MPTPPDPARPASPRPPVRPVPPRRDYAAEEAATRRLTDAQILLRRGQAAEAEQAVQAILAERPADLAALELLGDVQAGRGEWDAAGASYQAATGRASAEAKFARLTLRRAEEQRREKLGVAYAASDTALVGRGDAQAGKRGAWWSVLGSAVCPGLGQIVGGQYVKGAILAGVFLLCLFLFAHLPHGPGRASYFGPEFWLVSVVAAGDWLYAVADAGLSSSRAASRAPEKDGWQV